MAGDGRERGRKQLECKCDASLRHTAVQSRKLSGVMPELVLWSRVEVSQVIKEGGVHSWNPMWKSPKAQGLMLSLMYRCFEMFGKYKNEASKGPGHSLMSLKERLCIL